MKKEIAIKLREKAEEISRQYSNPEREFNPNHETFTVARIQPLSEMVACVTFLKSSGKKSLALFYYLNSSNGYWQYFFPTESHLYGLQKFPRLLQQLEEENFKQN